MSRKDRLDKQQGFHIVSLGFFCGGAMELERCGIRSDSLPFDWLITSRFESVLALMNNGFDGFIARENLYQEYETNPAYYFNKMYRIHFYHDFSGGIPFDDQYENVCKKFDRRIKRFYEVIKEPTIFLRYCSGPDEAAFIKDNVDRILHFLKSFNSENEIIYISSEQSLNCLEHHYYVAADYGDTVSRKFLKHISGLSDYLISKSRLSQDQIKSNVRIYKHKQRQRFVKRIIKKIINALGITRKKYHHTKQYSDIKNKQEQ